MTKNAELRAVVGLGATVAIAVALVACGRDGYVVVKEAKTPHRAFDLPTFGTNTAEKPAPPLPIVPIERPTLVPVPPLAPNPFPARPGRAAEVGAGSAGVSVTFSDPTGDRVSRFGEGTVKDCALFKTPGETAGQKTFLYAHFAAAGREMRLGLELTLYEGRTPLIDLSRLSPPYSLASLSLRPVLGARSLFEAKDSAVDAEAPPMWAMDTVLRRSKLDRACRAEASVQRADGKRKMEMSLSCGPIAGDASTDAIDSLDVGVACEARETTRIPYFAPEEKR